MTDPTNPGDIPDPGMPPPPPPPAAPAPPPPPPPASPTPPPPSAPEGGFPPPVGGSGFPPPTQAMPVTGDPLGPPPGPPAAKSKGPLIAVLAVVAVILAAVGFMAMSGGDDDTKDIASERTTTTDDATTTTAKADGPGGKEGTADEGEKEGEQPNDTASGDAQSYGDDPVLDGLYDQCEAGDYQACDDLYLQSGFGTDYEDFGDTCGNRNEPSGYCVDVYADGGDDGGTTDSIDGSGAMSYGDNAQLDALYDQCEAGDFQACDTLYMESDFGSEYEDFGDTCGDRNEPSGYCVDVYADGGGD